MSQSTEKIQGGNVAFLQVSAMIVMFKKIKERKQIKPLSLDMPLTCKHVLQLHYKGQNQSLPLVCVGMQ